MRTITFTEQKLLFDQSPFVTTIKDKRVVVPEDFYTKGYAVLDGINTPEEGLFLLESISSAFDKKKIPLYSRFLDRLQLAKADIIPVCDDVVATSFQVLHFDMGQPIISDMPQTMYFVTALYFPFDTPESTAKTRLVSIQGLLKDKQWGTQKDLEKKLITYAKNYGDGWNNTNTQRLACFARLIDGASDSTELAQYRDKMVAQWLETTDIVSAEENLALEHAFFAKHGIDLSLYEEYIQLKPGQLLFFDNTRVVHGRFGKRKRGEIYQFMFGVKNATKKDIDVFRKHLLSELTYGC